MVNARYQKKQFQISNLKFQIKITKQQCNYASLIIRIEL
jgi:hypothetical protein